MFFICFLSRKKLIIADNLYKIHLKMHIKSTQSLILYAQGLKKSPLNTPLEHFLPQGGAPKPHGSTSHQP